MSSDPWDSLGGIYLRKCISIPSPLHGRAASMKHFWHHSPRARQHASVCTRSLYTGWIFLERFGQREISHRFLNSPMVEHCSARQIIWEYSIGTHCERDALPTELYPRSGRHPIRLRWFFKLPKLSRIACPLSASARVRWIEQLCQSGSDLDVNLGGGAAFV